MCSGIFYWTMNSLKHGFMVLSLNVVTALHATSILEFSHILLEKEAIFALMTQLLTIMMYRVILASIGKWENVPVHDA